MIHAVLFDHDGVLVNSMPYHVEAWQQVMARHGVEIEPMEIYLKEGATTMEVAAELFHRHRKAASSEFVQQIAEEKGEAYLANNNAALNEGVVEVLEYLQQNRYRIGIVTGSLRAQSTRFSARRCWAILIASSAPMMSIMASPIPSRLFAPRRN